MSEEEEQFQLSNTGFAKNSLKMTMKKFEIIVT